MIQIKLGSMLMCLGVILHQMPQFELTDWESNGSMPHDFIVKRHPPVRPFEFKRTVNDWLTPDSNHNPKISVNYNTPSIDHQKSDSLNNSPHNPDASSELSMDRNRAESFESPHNSNAFSEFSTAHEESKPFDSSKQNDLTSDSTMDHVEPTGAFTLLNNTLSASSDLLSSASSTSSKVNSFNHPLDEDNVPIRGTLHAICVSNNKETKESILSPRHNELQDPSVRLSASKENQFFLRSSSNEERDKENRKSESIIEYNQDNSQSTGFSIRSLLHLVKKPSVSKQSFTLESATTYHAVEPTAETCSLNITELPHFHPWLLNSRTHKILYPTSGENVVIANGGELMLFCSGDDNHFYGVDKTRVVITKCLMGQLLYRDSTPVRLGHIRCHNMPTTILRKTTKKCHLNFVIYAVGFWIREQVDFVTIFELCVDNRKKDMLQTKYSMQQIHPAVQYHQQLLHIEHSKSQDPVHSSPVLIGSLKKKHKSTKFHVDTSMLFMHSYLARKENFVYRAEKMATFIIANSALKFISTENKKITKIMEASVRELAMSQGPITAYTGTSGVLTLGDITHDPINDGACPVKLQMQPSFKKRSTVPVPTIFWKVIHNADLTRSTALVSHNQGIKHVCSKLCDDVSTNVTWLTGWKLEISNSSDASPNDYYACEVSDFLDRDQSLLPFFHRLDMKLL